MKFMKITMLKVREQLSRRQIWLGSSYLMTLNSVVYFLVMIATLIPIASTLTECKKGFFKLDETSECRPFLECHDLNKIRLSEIVGRGAVKVVYRGIWDKTYVAVSKLADGKYTSDFLYGWNQLLKLQGPYVVKAVGFCNDTKTIVTEFHTRGNAVEIISRLPDNGIQIHDSKYRLRLCHNYAKILELLHGNNLVNCDSNTLEKTLSQLLINENNDLLLNDVDSLAENVGGVICGPRPLNGEFLAPEQISEDYPPPKYDEKTDIWKAASICQYFLSQLPNVVPILYRLHDIHTRCKNPSPELRPTARELVAEYDVEISKHDEL